MSENEALKVLLVDDDRVLSKYHAALLEATGFKVHHTPKPLEAVALVQDLDPDLIIVDYHMPELTGPELATRIRALPRGEIFGILLITADNNAQTLATAIRLGITSYINKPVDQELFPVVCRSIATNCRRIKETHAQLELASRNKSEILASMSHELRTPLNAVLGYAQILALDLEQSPIQREMVREIANAGEHLLALISDVIDLSKIEVGRIELSIVPVDLNLVLDEALAMVESKAHLSEISLAKDVSKNYTVLADNVRLRQVMVNLLSNAVKYNRPGGKVTVVTETLGDKLRIAITDTGIGIPQDKQHRIFTAFDRLGAESGSIEGTGIGLVITHRLVEAMQGQIGFNSTEGQGSTFWIDLPQWTDTPDIVTAPVEKTPIAAPKSSNTSRAVLYVEDIPLNVRVMQTIFSKRSDLVLRDAPNAKAGIDIACAEPPDLILMDINLPDMDGYAALQALKGWPQTAAIPVVAVTANAMVGDRERGLAAGFAEYITKPIDFVKLNEAINRLLNIS